MKYAVAIVFSACTVLLGCSQHSDVDPHAISVDSDVLNDTVQLDQGSIKLHPQDTAVAVITADGSLRIGSQHATTSATARTLLQSYYANVSMLHADDLAIDKAGDAVGNELAQRIKADVVDHPEHVDKKTIENDAKTAVKPLLDASLKLCQDLSDIKATQDQIVIQLPAFKPYGSIVTERDISNCRSDIHN